MAETGTPGEVGSNAGLGLGPEHGNGGGQLTMPEREAMGLLDSKYGTATGDLAQQMPSMRIWAFSRRTQSQCVLHVLRRLEACGLVKRLDNEKPVAWVLARANVALTGARTE